MNMCCIVVSMCWRKIIWSKFPSWPPRCQQRLLQAVRRFQGPSGLLVKVLGFAQKRPRFLGTCAELGTGFYLLFGINTPYIIDDIVSVIIYLRNLIIYLKTICETCIWDTFHICIYIYIHRCIYRRCILKYFPMPPTYICI